MLVAQSWPTLCNPMDCSPPGFSVHEIFQTRILEWVAIPYMLEGDTIQPLTDHFPLSEGQQAQCASRVRLYFLRRSTSPTLGLKNQKKGFYVRFLNKKGAAP